MDAAAEDDSERQRNRAKLYAPPATERGPGRRSRRPGDGMNSDQAQALMQQLVAEDDRLGGSRGG